ncbi:MAG: 3-hydroxylacyl-ACP dehydratase [Lautropia sp.]|nr:3-hydroxylacyl-ACP dehydratase [Lautropia sp.]
MTSLPGQEALDHDAIAARVPHAGPMCLLDRVLSWDADSLECTAAGCPPGGAASHPLASEGRLPATAAIEYAAQAMALHGRLVQEATVTAAQAPRRGFLAGLRSVRLHARWIGSESPVLTVRVERFAGDDVQVLYDFEVRGAGPIAQGRAVVVLDAAARAGADTLPTAQAAGLQPTADRP